MFIIRPAQQKDLSTLLKLARMVHFINLPDDQDLISLKIRKSRASFAREVKSERDRQFMFVLEDNETDNVIGTCGLISCISWPGSPHVFLEMGRREFMSKDLQTGIVHTTLKFGTDETGPSEVGGLILSPGYRRHKEKLGSLLSLVRFHFVGLHRDWFAKRIIAEMMGTVTSDSNTPLWDYLGRRFINLSYTEADLFSARSKEFMLSLFPREELYVSLLPPEARTLIGRVGEETAPAKAMLESQGFKAGNHVDPFDGGPYLEADRDEIPLVKVTTTKKFGGIATTPEGVAFVSVETNDDFRAARSAVQLSGDNVLLPEETIQALGLKDGTMIGFTPLSPLAEGGAKKKSVKVAS